jgi:hypothetical protein
VIIQSTVDRFTYIFVSKTAVEVKEFIKFLWEIGLFYSCRRVHADLTPCALV